MKSLTLSFNSPGGCSWWTCRDCCHPIGAWCRYQCAYNDKRKRNCRRQCALVGYRITWRRPRRCSILEGERSKTFRTKTRRRRAIIRRMNLDYTIDLFFRILDIPFPKLPPFILIFTTTDVDIICDDHLLNFCVTSFWL
jgi:hypothetical protein